MEKELDELIAKYEEGNMTLITLKAELLRLFSVMPRSYAIVRWHDNEYEDVVCKDRATAEEYVRKYNELTGWAKCFVDEDICLPLNEA